MRCRHTGFRRSFRHALALPSSWGLHTLVWTVALCQIILLILCTVKGEAAGPTPVSGEITQNQTWSPAGSPYVVTGDVILKPGVTLTLEPGTVVQFARIEKPKPWTTRAVLRVMGHLKAVGTMAAPVEFTLLEGEAMGDWGGIWVDGYYGGSAEVNYARISFAQRGIYASGATMHIQNSVLTGNLVAIQLEGGTGHLIENNNLSRNEYGLYADRAAGQVERNVIASNSWGVYNFMEKGLHIQHNDIKSNTFGIVHDGGTASQITMNDFSIRRANDYAILVRGGYPTTISYNNFLFDEQLALEPGSVFWYIFNESTYDIAAPNNWWDTIDSRIVEAYTFDKRDLATKGTVVYTPMASSRVKGTMDDLRPPQVDILDLAPCSPNGDGVSDTCLIPYSLSESAAEVTVNIIDATGTVGAVGDVLWARTYTSEGEYKLLTTDGTHSIGWNGTTASGVPVPEGVYEVRITALDVSLVGEGEAAALFRVDLTPPELQVHQPLPGTVLHMAEVDVQGLVRDASDVAVRIGNRAASVSASTDGWWAYQGKTVLTSADGTLAVVATDRAGNRTVSELAVVFDPWLTLQAPAITNQNGITVQGEVLNPSVVKRVEIHVTWPSGLSDTVFASLQPAEPFPKFVTQASVPLVRGRNLIVAYGYSQDDVGTEFLAASTAAWVEYNPFYDRKVQNTLAPGVSLITVPSTPFATDPGVALGLAGEWDLARWQETADGPGYVRYSVDPEHVEPLQPGRGYWLKLGSGYPQGHPTEVRGTLADYTTPYSIRLTSGWNLIGNPFLAAVPWSSVQVQVEGSSPVSWDTATAQGWLRPMLWGYASGGYRASTKLEPWQGYWVKTSRSLTLWVPPPAENPPLTSSAVAQREARVAAPYQQAPTTPAPGEWRLTMVARSGNAMDADNTLGVAGNATDGLDPLYDWEEPPVVMQGVTFSFYGLGQMLASDIRGVSHSSGVRVWQVAVRSSGTEPVYLSWPNLGMVPPQVQAVLIDESTGERVNLRQCREYVYTPETAGATRLMRLEIQETWDTAISSLVIYPNPWDGEGVVRFRVGLTGAATVTAGIYDAVGRLVRRLPGQISSGGTVELSWDGRTERGEVAPGGLYQVKVVAMGTGPTATAMERLVLWR